MSKVAWGHSFASLLVKDKPRQERLHAFQTAFVPQEEPVLAADIIAHIIPEYEDDQGKLHKWKILKNVEPSNIEAKNIELVSYLEKDEKPIGGVPLFQRAVILEANLCLIDGWNLYQHQNDIPVEMREKRIALPGTLLLDSVGSINLACLDWVEFDSQWHLGFYWFDWLWDNKSCLARNRFR